MAESLRLFRCYPRVSGARKGKPGHWSFVPPHQVHGRWDNSDLYDSWYFSRTQVGAIAESFYNKQRWIPEVFLTPTGSPRAIAEFSYQGAMPLNLDDAATLLELRVRPSEVVIRNLNRTQALARSVYQGGDEVGGGLSWWSSQVPSETSVVLWGAEGAPPPGLKLVGIQALSTEHPAVIEAAAQLYRRLG
ncbi:RES domain-containing protein [Leucobacter viscericola]|uniref:RES domain-containing protein n=1 Tax=Leucobacter viscericola TaxID=2714935 RepID=A0A6G7XC95_9MICO|nr:RES family NAD+ phosphorylase [Leucobacter viscericola]QIK62069.1 RES domain-containing protein [Leucobacter viscericola]